MNLRDALEKLRSGDEVWTSDVFFSYLREFEDMFARSDRRVIDATEGGALKKGTDVKLMGMKLTVKKKPARKARRGTNPFTGESMMFKAKPASKAVKVRALKALNDQI